MAAFDDIRQLLDRSLANHSPGEVIAYLQKWAKPGQELRLMLGGSHVQYPSVSDLGGRRDPDEGIPIPWVFNSAESADQFCSLVEQVFREASARCRIMGRINREEAPS